MSSRATPVWIVLGLAVVTIVVVLWQRSRPDAEALTMQVLATVEGQDLTVGRFNQSFLEYLMATGRNDTPEERYRHLDRLVRDMVLATEARKLGLDRSPEFESLVDRNRRLAVGAKYFEEAFAQSLGPLTEAEVREAFERSRQRVALRHLFFRDEDAARVAYDALRSGFDFMELARDLYGTAPDDSTAGFLGYSTYWDLDDAVAEAAYSLPVGSVSEPVRSRYGWHVLRVEDRLVNPLLTENDFLMHRAGIEGREKVRRNRLAGDRFIRDLMESLDVRVDEAGARALVDAMNAAVVRPQGSDPGSEASQRARVRITQAEIDDLRDQLEPETVLATLDLDGERAEFTAGDFLRWLPELPYDEVRDRTMAAVGRALRNEVLASRGVKAGYEDADLVRESIRFASDSWLASNLRAALRTSGRVEPSDEEIAEAFERLGYRKLERALADYWIVRTASVAAADSVRALLESGVDPAAVTGYAMATGADVRGDDLGFVRRAPLDQPVVGCSVDGTCYVLRVLRRDMVYTRLEDKRDEVRTVLRQLLPEERMTDSLLSVVSVRVDTTLFRTLMESVRTP